MSSRPRVFVTQPIAQSALERLRAIAEVKINTDSSKIIAKTKLIAAVRKCDILVTRVAGPALSHILPRVAGVVAELGGSTSHMASLARERGIPMVLGVLDATRKIPDGAQCAVDGVAGIVRWLR